MFDTPLNALSTNDINSYLHNVEKFKGTFPSDQVPFNKLTAESFVINTDSKQGEHWTAVFIDVNKNVFFFDPLGTQLLNTKILEKLKSLGVKKYVFSTRQIQPINSEGCGFYCIAFILALSHSYSYSHFLKMFSNQLLKNEEIVVRFIKQFI